MAFSEVLDLLERHDWELYRIHPPYRIFYRYGNPSTGLPILVEVHDGNVADVDVEKIRKILETGVSGEDGGKNDEP